MIKVGNIPLWVLLFTNFLSALIHMLLVSLIIYISASIIFKADYPMNLLTYFLSLLLFIIICIIIGIIIGLIAKKPSTMTMLSQLVFLPSLLLSGIMFPSDMLPEFFIKVSSIFPATHSIKILTASNKLTLNLMLPLIIIGVVVVATLVITYKKILVD